MRFLLLSLEEMQRDEDSTTGKCLNMFLKLSLAEKLWSPFRIIAMNPFYTLVVILVLYIIFCIIYIPLMLLTYIITIYGSLAVFAVELNYIAIMMATLLAFPGCCNAVQKDVASEFIKRITIQLCRIAHSIADLSATILLQSSNRHELDLITMPKSKQHQKKRTIQLSVEYIAELRQITIMLPEMAKHFASALQDSQRALRTNDSWWSFLTIFGNSRSLTSQSFGTSNTASDQSDILVTVFCKSVDEFSKSILELYLIVSDTTHMIPSGNASTSSVTPIQYQQLQQRNQLLFASASRCLKASEALKQDALAVRPPKASAEDSSSDGLFRKAKAFLGLDGGISGINKLAFPYMRSFLRDAYSAVNITLTGANQNIIDVMYLPCGAVQLALQANSSNNNWRSQAKRGVVLFCSPNAGFYECLSQADLQASWLGFYSQQGFDLVAFNYRGYNLSTGAPTPTAVKSDALTVARHLMNDFTPQTIFIVHGESIGGMVACHLAKECARVDALICDRTFASLDAVACRMLGSWAGYGLRFIGRWTSDVVTDYLACNCSKVILQDPDDQIISNSASLKNGVATYLTYSDTAWVPRSQSNEYVLAAVKNDPIPLSGSQMERLLLEEIESQNRVESLQYSISEEFVCHFYACISHLVKKCEDLMVKRVKKKRNLNDGKEPHNYNHKQQVNFRGIKSPSGDIDIGNTNNSHNNSNDNKGIEMTNSSFSGTATVITDNSSSNESLNTTHATTTNNNERVLSLLADKSHFSSEAEWLHAYFSLSIRETPSADFTELEMVWLCLRRLDGGSGQLFFNSLRWELDGVRSWIASFVVWGSRAEPDEHLPANRCDMRTTIADLTLLVQELHPATLQREPAVMFILQALTVLESRRAACSHGKHGELEVIEEGGVASPSSSRRRRHGESNYAGNDVGDGEFAGSIGPYHHPHQQQHHGVEDDVVPLIMPPQLGDQQQQGEDCCCAGCVTVSILNNHVMCKKQTKQHLQRSRDKVQQHQLQFFKQQLSVGRVIPLHCGHNGWLAPSELQLVSQFLQGIGLK